MNATGTPAPSAAVAMQERRARSETKTLWVGAMLTAVTAALFPRLNAVLHENQAFWELDTEAAVGIPSVIAATFAVFAVLGGWAWRRDGTRNHPAKVGLVCGILGLVGVVAFFVSAPIVLGGLAVTLGREGTRRAALEGRPGLARAATILGGVAILVGVAMWLAV